MKSLAYREGAKTANAEFGLRQSAVVGRMPDGPGHIGASRFAKAIGTLEAPEQQREVWSKPLNRTTGWGEKSSPEAAGNTINADVALRYGGV